MQKVRCGICIILSLIFCSTLFCFSANISSPVAKCEESKLEIHFIDVGQGDSALIILPDGKVMLIDGGKEEYGKEVVEYLTSLNINTIDYMVATHSDSDHVGGLIDVLKNKDVKNIYRPFDLCRTITNSGFVDELYARFSSRFPVNIIVDNPVYAEFLECVYNEKVEEQNATINVCSSAIQLASSDRSPYIIKFFNPVAQEEFSTSRIQKGYTTKLTEDQNDTSAVIGLFTENHKYLFMADLGAEEEANFIARLTPFEREQLSSVSVLKVAHHGSKSSTSKEFLSLVKPSRSVISVGENDYGHPTEAVLTRLTDAGSIIYRTDEQGTIIFEEVNGFLTARSLGKDESNSGKVVIIILLSVCVAVILLLAIFWKKIKFLVAKKKLSKIK